MQRFNRSVWLLIFLVISLQSSVNAQCTQCIFPDESWQQAPADTLVTLGWSDKALKNTYYHLRDSTNFTGFMVVDRGHLIYEYGDTEELSYIASVRKSVLSMLYGYWVERGIIDLNTTLEELDFDDVEGLLPIERKATIRHLITARSGVYHSASNKGDNSADAPPRGSQEPGSYMLYNNWDFNAAGAVFEQLTQRNIYDELQGQLATPLQFEHWDRAAQKKYYNPTVSNNPAYHIWLSTRDLARMGHLMLNEGNWAGKQVLSADWVRTSTSLVTPLEEMNPEWFRESYLGYGYMWWIWDGPRSRGPFEGAYLASGAYGQYIAIFPAIDLVIATKSKFAYRRNASLASFERVIELLFEAKAVEMDAPYPWR